MPHRRSLLFRILIAALVLGPLGRTTASAQGDAALPVAVFAERGVDLAVVAAADAELAAGAGTHLTLERVTVPTETEFGPFAPTTPTLVAVEQGAFVSEDDRGFLARVDAPFQTVLAPPTAVTWTTSEATSLLLLSLDEPAAFPEAAGIERETIASLPAPQLPEGAVTFFVASVGIQPNSASVRVDHTGPVGLSIRSGRVEVLSPSGLEGALETGASMIFPAGAPLDLLGSAGEEASAVIFGVVERAAPETILQATVTDICRNLGIACTDPGTTLANGETWQGPTGTLTMLGSTGSDPGTWVAGPQLRLELTYRNTGENAVDFSVDPTTISVTSDDGQAWYPTGSAHRFQLEPGESDQMVVRVSPPADVGPGQVQITVTDFGDIDHAQWQGTTEAATTTAPGTMLAFGDTWVTESADLTLSVGPTRGTSTAGDVEVTLAYVNKRNEPVEFTVNPTSIAAEFEVGGRLTTTQTRLVDFDLAPGEVGTITLESKIPTGRTGASW